MRRCFLMFHGSFFAVFAAIDLFFVIGQYKDVRQFLFDRCDTAGILALDDVRDLFGQFKRFLFDYLTVLDDVDGDAVVYESQYVKV